jgi:polysaccharide deacetylase family protein (PEP-CTERM system associated)
MITVDVEEWYHSNWFETTEVEKKALETCSEGVARILDLFGELKIKATFFFLAESVVKYPRLVEDVVSEGHEIACHGFSHVFSKNQTKLGEVDQIKKAKRILEKAAGESVIGYRGPNFHTSIQVIRALSRIGFQYDSSIVPCVTIPGWYGSPFSPIIPYRLNVESGATPMKTMWEIPIAVHPRLRIPAGGGWFLRNFGFNWVMSSVKALSKLGPVTLYLHPWEVVETQPNIAGIPFHVFRRTGKYVRDALAAIVENLRTRTVTISNFLNS